MPILAELVASQNGLTLRSLDKDLSPLSPPLSALKPKPSTDFPNRPGNNITELAGRPKGDCSYDLSRNPLSRISELLGKMVVGVQGFAGLGWRAFCWESLLVFRITARGECSYARGFCTPEP